ncbi:branched-chain amino acid ABC transporter substrate-binding protein [Alloalcanivorax profundimaris]|uniref:branched-chain amino acid ABC transporter substrate-binding protein n=1 Tax=Alloalcanivorax profundimaris TaxID=2735259 RepID=UPI0018888398|nr:branched-chain amino acid ABC transporter substrate-binding protein [Alloalcanivorax profundimaris]MBF1801242.1 branched-chain amino acid ABC transporter substrate-binding protein [Alloalcanivorax profundimaris]
MVRPFLKLFAVSLVLLSGLARAADAEPVRFALIDPLTGPMSVVGQPALAQLQFTAERLNRDGGMDGHPIEIVGYDNKINPQESLVQLQKAIDDGIRYIIQGNGSSVGSALLSAINKHNQRNPDDRVLYLNYAAIEPSFTNERCSFWHFRFDSHVDMKMNMLTDWIADNPDVKKVFLINQDYSFGHTVSESAMRMLKKKRPDIEIVGNTFHPLGKVKDFSPYISKIKSSGADVVITGNWGQDINLLIKSAAEYGVDVPFLTYYGSTPGTITQVGDKGVDRVYLIAEYHGDFTDPEIAERQVSLYKEKGWDYYPRVAAMLEMMKKAGDEAGSVDPLAVAKTLEGLEYDSAGGHLTMRAADHQLQMPLYLSVLKDNMKYGAEGTDYNFHQVARFDADQATLPTTCRMRRPD